ncbi:MAG TPA: hypothetical protein VN714_21650, partial [Trebonia sp.]|nr:hypothetical protein [Trebonia sp.]
MEGRVVVVAAASALGEHCSAEHVGAPPLTKTLPNAMVRSPSQTAYCRPFGLPTHDTAMSVTHGAVKP